MRRGIWLAVIGSAVSITGLGACAESTRPPASPPAVASEKAAAPAKGAEAPAPSTLRRSDVRRVVAGGLGAFLQRVAIDEHPVMAGGKFHGFRVAALSGDPEFWRGVDIRPGDVVTRVNGMPIEHPEEALEAFRSLDVASELRVDLERDGAPRSLRYAIVDDAR